MNLEKKEDNQRIDKSEVIYKDNNDYKIYHYTKPNHYMFKKISSWLVDHKVMTEDQVVASYNIFKENFNIFAMWISELSWGRFVVFLILCNILSNIFIDMFSHTFFGNVLNSIGSILMVGAIALKVFMKNKVKSEARVKQAELIAEKEMLQRQLVEAKIQVMQAQIEPHFLFNTLASLDYLINTDQEKASKMLMSLVSYLRYALPQIRENQFFNTLGKEIENIKSYLNIMVIRMGERLNVKYDISPLLSEVKFPSMMLQPIVENAIKYGIEQSVEDGVITISAKYQEDSLEVCVSDTGPGLYQNQSNKGNGMALNNISSRLDMLYNKKAKLTIENNYPKGVIVKINIPL